MKKITAFFALLFSTQAALAAETFENPRMSPTGAPPTITFRVEINSTNQFCIEKGYGWGSLMAVEYSNFEYYVKYDASQNYWFWDVAGSNPAQSSVPLIAKVVCQ